MISRGVVGSDERLRCSTPFHSHVLRQKFRALVGDGQREVHRIPQGEGGEQGDPMMPLLCSLGQHGALESTNDRITRGERLLAFLDDTFIVTSTEAEVGLAHGHVHKALRNHWHPHSCRKDEDMEPGRQLTHDL